VGVPTGSSAKAGAQIRPVGRRPSPRSTPTRRFPRSCGRQPRTSTGTRPVRRSLRRVRPNRSAPPREDAAIGPGSLGPRAAVLYEVVASCCITETESVADPDHAPGEQVEPRVERVLREIARDEVIHGRNRLGTPAEGGIDLRRLFSPPWIPAMLGARSTRALRRRGRGSESRELLRPRRGFRIRSRDRSSSARSRESSSPDWRIRNSPRLPPMAGARSQEPGASRAEVGGVRSASIRIARESDADEIAAIYRRGSSDRRLLRAGAAQRSDMSQRHRDVGFVRALAGLRRDGRCPWGYAYASKHATGPRTSGRWTSPSTCARIGEARCRPRPLRVLFALLRLQGFVAAHAGITQPTAGA